ncbi:Hypothetical protein BQ3484_119 [Cedratvirus A11]|uniref:Uncharacterized protein n=1 Tax=Cedratvirus A11 TaxID=1903266 RepID=A0A1M7XU22_9VIRU|nr:Hypothetical protein BQ3484_119 [Cedratvirus A11]SHO33187.1 Hypothetical protein BQ3484_119 [Cedratvirus A11]
MSSSKQLERLEEFLRQMEELDYEVDKETLQGMVTELKGEDLRPVPCDIQDAVTLLNTGPFEKSKCCSAEFRNDHTIWIIHQWYTDWVHISVKVYRDVLIIKKLVYGEKFNRPKVPIEEEGTHDNSVEDIANTIYCLYTGYEHLHCI